VRLPWEIYPKESMENHEVDKVVMQLAFDPDWCVREARIVWDANRQKRLLSRLDQMEWTQ
jgi:hypothetical protein